MLVSVVIAMETRPTEKLILIFRIIPSSAVSYAMLAFFFKAERFIFQQMEGSQHVKMKSHSVLIFLISARTQVSFACVGERAIHVQEVRFQTKLNNLGKNLFFFILPHVLQLH